MKLAPPVAKPLPTPKGKPLRRAPAPVRARVPDEPSESDVDSSELDSNAHESLARSHNPSLGASSPPSKPTHIASRIVVGAAHDPLEHEADAIADRVMRMSAPHDAATPRTHPAETPWANTLRRACKACCDACEDDDEPLRREPAAGQRGGVASEAFAARLDARTRLGGSPLTPDARAFLEPRLRVGLDHVRTHTDASADSLARNVGARAFTVGQHIFFAAGELQPHTAAADPSTSFEPVPARELLSRGIMAKLVVGAANDPLEHEADAIADRVMRMPVANASAGIRRLAFTRATIQRTCSTCEAEDDELHRTMAPLQRACSSCEAEDDELQRTTASLQRACTACEAEDEDLRREPAAGARGGPTTPRFTARVHDLQRQGGHPLTTDARAFFEPRFNTDLTEVRLHTDRTAAQLAQQIHARAFTSGQHIFFGPGEHRPHSQAGQRLLAHELAHTQQNARAETKLHRSAADNLVSSMDNTAEYVIEDIAYGVFRTSNDFEERVRKLSKSERGRLWDMMVDQSWEDQVVVDELIQVLDNVMNGHVGGTVGHVESRSCEPGDVEPVSMDEWTGDPIITDLELLDGSGESEGKLGRHTPPTTLKLFQRALVQWGCESAEPARNPLPEYGVDGSYGGEFRRAVRQFQRLERLSADGTAGPTTVKAMASELYGINLRGDVEREQDLDHAQEQLDAEAAIDADLAAREARIERFIQRLYAEGKRYRENQGAQYEANVSMLVAQKIRGYAPEIISEGLERVQLQDPDFYEHVLFGGRLITSLQELGVFGVEYTPPSDADFLDGFIIESRNLDHASPLNSPEFSGWDIPEIFVGFQIGTAQGIAKGFVEAVEGIAAMFTAEFWKAMYEMVPKLISEPNFRFEIGRASAEMLHKQLTELNASSPYDYGNKLGVLFGMLVLEVAVGVLTGGAGAAALKGFDGAKLLAKFPRLEKLGKRVASTSLARAGAKLGSKLAEGTMKIVARVDELIVRVRKLLPDLTSDAKLGSKLDEFEDADRLIALADQKAITRKLEQVEFERTKVDLALDRAEPDFDQVDRLATGMEKRAAELEDLLESKGAGKRGVSPAAVSKQTLELVEQGRDIQKLSKLPPEVRAAELRYVDAAQGREISLKIWDKDFDREVELPNAHTYRHADEEKTWCRFSEGGPDNCLAPNSDSQISTYAGEETHIDPPLRVRLPVDESFTVRRVMTIDKDGNEVMRRFVTNGDGLRNAADAAAGGNIGDFDELKDYFYEGKLGDGTRLKIELNPDGHANTNEGPHVKIQIWDPEKTGKSKSKLGGWRTTEKHFIEGREHFKEEYDWKTEMKKWEEEVKKWEEENNGSN